jgi:FkbM family methyltransferase
MTYLDIGANIGYFVALAASKLGLRGHVIAVEPDPHNFALLSRTVRTNKWRNVTLLNIAAGAHQGTARLFRSAENLGDHRLYSDAEGSARVAIDVPVRMIESELAARRLPAPDVVKIDVQGYEELAFRGMRALVRRSAPMIVLTEFWPLGIVNAGGDPQAYLRMFSENGFACFHPGIDGLTPVPWQNVWELIPPADPLRPDWAMVNLVFRRG